MQKLNLDVKKIVLIPEYNDEVDIVLFYHNDPFLGDEDTIMGVGVPISKGNAWLNKLGLKADEVMNTHDDDAMKRFIKAFSSLLFHLK